MLDRGKASRLLELATIQITEEAKRHSVQKRQTFDFTSTRFNVGTRQGSQLATPNVQLVTSEEFDALINDALEKLKDGVIPRRFRIICNMKAMTVNDKTAS